MKNSAMPAEDRTGSKPLATEAWREAMALFDADLRRRGMAEKTRRAYGLDLGQFALWCSTQALEPPQVTPRTLRRYAALLSDRRNVAATVARKLAALRAFFRTMREHGVVAHNPADLLPAPKRPAQLPRVLRPDEVAALLDRIPASTPLELRDRALFEVAYASGLRAEELVALDVRAVSFDGEELRVEGKGSKTRIVPGPARPRWSAACRRTRCATRSPPTCSTAAPTCGRSRSCSATLPSPRPRSTLG
jgi:site-specific recombinase XerD